MNTLIHLWIEPLIMNHKRSNEKIYFNCIIKGDHTGLSIDEIDELLQGEIIEDIMDFANIESNFNYHPISAKRTTKDISINYANSAEKDEEIKEKNKITSLVKRAVKSKKDILLKKENITVNNGGKLDISLPSLGIKDSIDFSKIWDSLEKNFIGKIKAGDSIILKDEYGNTVFEIKEGNFLSLVGADLNVYDSKINTNSSIYDRSEALKGGLYIRDDGSIDIGDKKRTFYLKIYTNRLLKAALKLNKSVMEITSQKLLKY